MKDSTLINWKYKQIRKWKKKIYKLFDKREEAIYSTHDRDRSDLMYLADLIKSIKLTKMEIKKIKEKGGE